MSLVSSNPQPLAGRSEADGPLFEYTLYVFYPNEGGRVTESGWSVARQLAARLRDEAANVERTAGITPQASSTERSEEEACRCAPTPLAALTQVSEAAFLKLVEAAGEWQDWDGDRIAAAVVRAREALRLNGIEVSRG